MGKNKRNWESIQGRKGKRFVNRESGKKARGSKRMADGKGFSEATSHRNYQGFRHFDNRDDFDREENTSLVIGRNPVMELLRSEKAIDKLYVAEGSQGSMVKIIAQAREQGIVIISSEKVVLDRMTMGQNHQGVVAQIPALEYKELEDVFALAEERSEDPFVIILDGIEDPHNLGSIIRSAECAGVHGVIIPKRHSCGLTETVVKSAAGAALYMPVVRVTNIGQTIDNLKERGLWICACDMNGQSYYNANLNGSVGIVIGNEGRGISDLVKKKCDFVVSLPMKGNINSLNASNAATVVMYEVVRQRKLQGNN